ncbi:hypothetical protein [Dysgonomonas sp. BGC7]|uniref:hypothetical protein n=1 Tax=Dysgonomonas sp. BGC7 TaxID=1658008 RepID=UPI0006815A25|nr:hypothetical protein [Dysgonomonas sp. BGC7]MBD8388147.1 hypothetical protein [Dysgonomonas sp. BGC7]
MDNDDKTRKDNTPLDNRLGAPMKKVDGLSCDKKKSESEHLYAFRGDVHINSKNDDDLEKK